MTEDEKKLVLIITATIIITATVAGFVGYRIGSIPQTINVHLDAPLTINKAP